MQRKVLYAAVALALLAALVAPVLPAAAQSATAQTWTSSITYYTPDAAGGELWIDYYYEAGGLAKSYSVGHIAGHKAGSLYIGDAGVPSGFTGGSAVMRATVPVIATYVQYAVSPETANYGRPMYTGFSSTDAATSFNIPTFMYQNSGTTSLISVQNVEASQITVEVKVYRIGETTPTFTHTYTLPAYSAEILGPSDFGLTAGFSGSVALSATGGSIVASAQETQDAGRGAYAFEGSAAGANTVYMATALCQYAADQMTSYYAIQNTSTTASASVVIAYYDKQGNNIANTAAFTITPGGKANGSDCANVPAGTIGSAVITSTGAPVIAMGKIVSANGLRTAYVGQAAGATKVAAPYIRWAANHSTEFRSYIAVMNVGGAAANSVVANYYDATGALAGSETLATAASPLGRYIKANTDAYHANALSNGSFGIVPYGGAVEIVSDQPIVVVVRCTRVVSLGSTTVLGEDYNGLAVP